MTHTCVQCTRRLKKSTEPPRGGGWVVQQKLPLTKMRQGWFHSRQHQSVEPERDGTLDSGPPAERRSSLPPSLPPPPPRRRHTDFQDPPLGSLSFHAITWQKRRLFPVSRSRERVNTLLQLHDYDDDDDDNVRLCTRTAVAFTLVASATGYARTLGPPPQKNGDTRFVLFFCFK